MSKKDEVIKDEVTEDEIIEDSDDLEKTDDELREEERQAETDEATDELSPKDDPETKEEPEEPPRFKLDVPEEPQEAEGDGDSELIDIIHNGQAHRLTKERIIELAQKGFDYDYKVGPHGKLVKMIEADPELADMINTHWQKKVKGTDTDSVALEPFKVTSLDDYENESTWLQENLDAAIEYGKAQSPAPNLQTTPVKNTKAEDALRMRDPEHFNKVLPMLGKYAGQLTVDDYYRVDNDMASLVQFYDFVKEQVLAETPAGRQDPKPPVVTRSKPSFRVRSGGGEAPRTGSTNNEAWKLSKADFQKQLDKVKGYG